MKKTLVFLHGFLGDIKDFDAVIDELGDEFNHILIDLKTVKSANIEAAATDINHYLLDNGIVEYTPVGYSLGGRIAMHLHTGFHDIKRSIFISSNPGIIDVEERFTRRENDYKLSQKLQINVDEFIDTWYKHELFSNLRRQNNFQEIIARRHKTDFRHAAHMLHNWGLGSQKNLWVDFEKNQKPFLYLCGKEDRKYMRVGEKLRKVPLGTVENIRGGGHALHLEAAQEVAKHIKIFTTQQNLKRQSPF